MAHWLLPLVFLFFFMYIYIHCPFECQVPPGFKLRQPPFRRVPFCVFCLADVFEPIVFFSLDRVTS